jgi:UDP-N-acetylmuramoyl-L-alanyl-D-glutamate--2,6-diaminopimelate ligase
MMTLLADDLKKSGAAITRLVSDSRAVKPGDTFVAYPGAQADGRRFIESAIARGAASVIWEAHNYQWNTEWNVPHRAVKDLRHQIGYLADHVYGHPSRQLWMLGITGTNGKTSISHWLADALGQLGKKSALLGTLGNGFPGALQATLNTTPDALLLHGLLAEYLQQGAQAAVMEVSSHALEQGRVNGVHYDVALLTNLTRDHLDYHGDMHSYAAAKRRLFDWAELGCAVLNLDDEYGATLAAELQDAEAEVVGYGLEEESLMLAESLGIRMVYGSTTRLDAQGLALHLHTSWGVGELHSGLLGRFNASNLLGALAVLLVSDVALSDAARVLGKQAAVAGRMQTLGGNGKPTVVVDYAHTPDALEKVLATLREVSSGKVICVFGCGGDRDRGKRPMMGKAVSRFADVSIITSDNPRSEPPEAIIAEIVPAMSGEYQVIADRAEAIVHAIATAQANDTVLLAGKGHEDYQEINGVRHAFSDCEVAQRALSEWQSRERQT